MPASWARRSADRIACRRALRSPPFGSLLPGACGRRFAGPGRSACVPSPGGDPGKCCTAQDTRSGSSPSCGQTRHPSALAGADRRGVPYISSYRHGAKAEAFVRPCLASRVRREAALFHAVCAAAAAALAREKRISFSRRCFQADRVSQEAEYARPGSRCTFVSAHTSLVLWVKLVHCGLDRS